MLFPLFAIATAHGQTPGYSVLHGFGGVNDGGMPYGGVSVDSYGNLYGTAEFGGANGNGMVWELTASGSYLDLHDFGSGNDGYYPASPVTIGPDGTLYGTAHAGGQNGGGMLWKISAGAYADLYDFGGVSTDGIQPQSNIVIDASGNLYGTNLNGGTSYGGTVWEYTTAGTLIPLYEFPEGFMGCSPQGNIVLDSSGDLYGTTQSGGTNQQGNLWEITSGGTYVDLHDFGSAGDGANPLGGVSVDAAGNMYGTTRNGGADYTGIVWELSTGGTYIDLHDFGSIANDGLEPVAGVTVDAAGNLYGTTQTGGPNIVPNGYGGGGIVWEIPSGGAYMDLHDFGGSGDGFQPYAGVAVDSSGNVYGTTNQGGGWGILWVISQLTSLSVSPTSVIGGSPSTGTVTISYPAPVGGTAVSLSSGSSAASVQSTVTVAQGQTSATFPITTNSPAQNTNALITAQLGGSSEQQPLSVAASTLSGLTLNPSTVAGGNSSTGTITLTGPAPSAGLTVSLASTCTYATVPSSITVPGGSSSTTFSITTRSYTGALNATITAKVGGVSQSAVLAIQVPVLTGLTLSPGTVAGGNTVTATVTLSGTAPSTGDKVYLCSSSTVAPVPSYVTVPSGQSSTTFQITTASYTYATNAKITAGMSGVSETTWLSIQASVLSSLTLSPSTVTGGNSVTGTVTLTGTAPTNGLVVTLTSTSADATVPTSVTVPAGYSSVSFNIPTTAYKQLVYATITASAAGESQSALLTIQAASLSGLTLSPSTVVGGNSSTGTITLTGPAPSGGLTVYLSSTSSYATVPTSVPFTAGQTTATFTINTLPYTGTYTPTITAALSGSPSQTALLTVTPH